jgi:N-acetylmuramoyl-L-alanine amidase
MKVTDDQRFALDAGEVFNYRFETSPNFKPGLIPQQILIYATQRKDVQSQVNKFKTGVNSAHLIIGKDGREIVQMVGFDKIAFHNQTFNKTALAIRLDSPGALTNSRNRFDSVSNFDPSQILISTPVRGTTSRPWLIYPKTQLDALLVVLQALLEKYPSIESILANDEAVQGEIDPGPTFPRTLFREKLITGRGTLDTLEETNQQVTLRAGPSLQFRTLHPHTLPKGTQVSIINQEGDWLLIEALEEIEGNAWIVGWVQEQFVSARIYVPVVRNDLLQTEDGRRYSFIPAHDTNYSPKPALDPPKYIVMHFTTGTQLSSTINWFQKPGTASTHLLIGRDGRVIQFVPFNHRGHHVGFSFWEGERDLNRFTIGIELDNAGYLRRENGQWFRKKTLIPEERVTEIEHWKGTGKRGWEKFPDVQIKAAIEVVKALVAHYNIQDIIGHDMLNLVNRSDPGPLFPMAAWQREIFAREEPNFIPHFIANETGQTEIFANPGGSPPKIPHPEFPGKLPERSGVKVIEKQDKWSLVKVLNSSKGVFVNRVGWVMANSIRNNTLMDKTTLDQVLFKHLGKDSAPPPFQKKGSPLQNGTRVRILERQPDWTLVFVIPDPENKIKWMEGWVNSEAVHPLIV